MAQELVTVKTIMKKFNLNCICGKEGLKRPILVENINRAGMELMGFFEHSDLRRIIVFGNKEINYISSKTSEELRPAFEFLINEITPCMIITQGNTCPKELKKIAEKRNFPILLGDNSTNKMIIELMYYLNELMAPKMSMHATLLEIYGRGVLLTGASGIGKSEIALELVRRGHRLVADDRVDLVNINKKLTGTCPELTKGVMEVRGIGIINVASMFGISSYKDRQDVDYVIELKLLDENYSFERIDTSDHFKNILGVYIPNIQIPVSSGRNLADLIEVAVRNELLKAQGIDASKEFAKKLNDLLNVKGD
jgi:HPr kinase/phosphorylase